ncbi:putative RNA methyltransferase [Arachis hypogaea]|nr:putative RNA methyltransferase [Arachis hypogaea]
MFRCESILAIDIDPELVERANKNLRKAAESEMQIGESFKNLIDVVTFKQENFVESQHPELYHTVTCFSVTQWIHLNYGDRGLIKFFYKIWEVLRPGGVLILEPQAWKSYVIKHDVSPIGFKSVEHINPSWSKANLRYNRHILVFKK